MSHQVGRLLAYLLVTCVYVCRAQLENSMTARLDNPTIENTVLEGTVTHLQSQVNQLSEENLVLQSSLENATQRIAVLEAMVARSTCLKGMPSTRSRQEVLLWGLIPALCDTETDGGGWIIIQRRTKGDVDFYRGWADYKNGFGTPDTDYWIGLDIIHNLTTQGFSKLRFDMQDNGMNYYAHYSRFTVADELSKYQLSVMKHTGNVYDMFNYHSGSLFTTYDSDNDIDTEENCAEEFHGAWWYRDCYTSNLNGQWGAASMKGVIWGGLTPGRSLDSIEMKVRQE